ncbi:hypothetical protein PPTG_21643 [Phytophthora nicotianae INRA-310]|uniref:Uncharacterized protein n=1 Tax=Phytophthora nicotianae (strain INRA-310) TaxID=761204 RepID=W2QWQ1_PHYN3|nr:hypothetical protein PPTG_21643 [Phytophthora nicotianae INRA-310]ETN17336.1 hypothetical protein PPTG_21643 [Phytophthora nicotianae INRA-310]
MVKKSAAQVAEAGVVALHRFPPSLKYPTQQLWSWREQRAVCTYSNSVMPLLAQNEVGQILGTTLTNSENHEETELLKCMVAKKTTESDGSRWLKMPSFLQKPAS